MKRVVAGLGIILVILFVLCVGCGFLHGETTPNRRNSLGISDVYENPNTYLFGLPVEGVDLDDGKYVSIRFKPYNTASLYDENVLFCDAGRTMEAFHSTEGPVIVTYQTVAHKMFKGIACHEIVSVFEVQHDQTSQGPQ
jgi:hypothetical protein